MASVPPPQGMNEVDYEAIEAAVTETVRGRWFLTEFARRNRLAETRQLLDAMSRIEAAVAGGQVALPTVDPSIRLLVQRIKEIASQLGEVAGDMREAGVEEHFVEAVDLQSRAVAGMMRSATLPPKDPLKESLPSRETAPASRAALPPSAAQIPSDATRVPPLSPPSPRLPRAELPPTLTNSPLAALAKSPPAAVAKSPPMVPPLGSPLDDPRLAALSGLDSMTLAKKLALFS